MNNPHPKRRSIFAIILTVGAGALLLSSLKLPLWQMRLEAPQYRDEEALHVFVRPNAMGGDLKEISVLNQYIGVHVPENLPQFKWLPAALAASAFLGIAATLLKGSARRYTLIVVASGLVAALGVASLQAKSQIYKIGHERDQHTKLAGIKDFTPPFLGTAKIAQFTVTSRLGTGAWLVGAALALQLTAACLKTRPAANAKRRRDIHSLPGTASALPAPTR
jgi:hypothetical protein